MRAILFAMIAVFGLAGAAQAAEKTEIATFAGGCFWCTESDFDKVPGVIATVSGFMGGHVKNPTYKQVVREDTGHAEVVQITFDPSIISYRQLVDKFWRTIDPLDAGGQFCDRGNSYRTEIFYHSAAQKATAEASKAAIAGKFREPIVTKITAASAFTAAEEYHQDYHNKNPWSYSRYRNGCGRDARIEMLWGSKSN